MSYFPTSPAPIFRRQRFDRRWREGAVERGGRDCRQASQAEGGPHARLPIRRLQDHIQGTGPEESPSQQE